MKVNVVFVSETDGVCRLVEMTQEEYGEMVRPATENELPIDTSTISEDWYDWYERGRDVMDIKSGIYHHLIEIV